MSLLQEFFAYGVMNFGGSFFGSFPTAGALSRTVLQDATGGNTQLVGVISSVIVIVVILFLGTLFGPLPSVRDPLYYYSRRTIDACMYSNVCIVESFKGETYCRMQYCGRNHISIVKQTICSFQLSLRNSQFLSNFLPLKLLCAHVCGKHCKYSLLQAALAAIVVVALKGLYFQLRDIYKFYKLSLHDMVRLSTSEQCRLA